MDAELAYWRTHHAALWRRYPDRYVAVYAGEVIADDADLVRLLDELRARNLDPAHAWVRFIPAPARHYVRPSLRAP